MQSFVVTVRTADVDLASDRLWQLGVRAVEERSTDTADTVELWTSVGDDPAAIRRAADAIGDRWSWRTEQTDTSASETWRDFAEPIWVRDAMVVVPAWQEVPSGVADGMPVLAIEPGGAFGLGDHPTTWLSLEALADEIGRRNNAPMVLDVGCGTGILSVAAAMLGAAGVRAIDVADEAVAATGDNARRNRVDDLIEVDGAPVAKVEGPFDIVVANILAPTLIAMAADLRRLVASDGALIVSGVLADRHDHVLDALQPLRVVNATTSAGWAASTLHR